MSDAPRTKSAKSLKFIENEDSSIQTKSIDVDGVSETEIVTEIIVPEEGRWKWIVVAGSFMCAFITEGIFLTFGSIYKNISEDLATDVSLVTLVNSISIALLYITSPIVSAFVNTFGFRICTMIGSIIVSLAYLTTYFVKSYAFLLLFYGVVTGIGACFIILPAQLIVGFYFERLRALAIAIAGLGASFGITIMSRVNTYIVLLSGWRTVILFQAGLFGMIYFIAMVFRPLLSLSVTTDDEGMQAVTYLPSLSTIVIKAGPSQVKVAPPTTSPTEKLFSAVSNVHFPTAANLLEQVEPEPVGKGPGPSPVPTRKLTFMARQPEGGITEKQLKQAQSIMSPKSFADVNKQVKITMNNVVSQKKRHWCFRCCHWESHVKESRPMYRDDAFYHGSVQNLSVYKEQMLNTKEGSKTGLEYQMAVSRAAAISDLEERKGICTTAVRRVLATMLDPQLLKRNSFFMVCITNFLVFLGLVIPYVFLPDRNRSEGIADVHCNSFVSVMGLCSGVGRLNAGLLACKLNVLKIYTAGCIVAGLTLIVSNLSFNVYYQYGCCAIFGFSSAHVNTLRSPVLVDLYGLDNLTNATGMVLMFAGFGSLISTPLSGFLSTHFGFKASFYAAGTFITIGGFVMINVKRIAKSEMRKKAKKITPGKYSSVVIKKKKLKSVENLAPIPENNVAK